MDKLSYVLTCAEQGGSHPLSRPWAAVTPQSGPDPYRQKSLGFVFKYQDLLTSHQDDLLSTACPHGIGGSTDEGSVDHSIHRVDKQLRTLGDCGGWKHTRGPRGMGWGEEHSRHPGRAG